MTDEAFDPRRILVLDDFLTDYDPLREPSRLPAEFADLRSNYREQGILGNNTTVASCSRFQDVVDNIPRACEKMGLPRLKSVSTLVYIVSEAGDPFRRNIHRDDTSNNEWGYTFSYHWQGLAGSGGTVWYTDMLGTEELHRVEFRPNRLVAFPARYPHTGYANLNQPNASRRVILATFTVLDPRRY